MWYYFNPDGGSCFDILEYHAQLKELEKESKKKQKKPCLQHGFH